MGVCLSCIVWFAVACKCVFVFVCACQPIGFESAARKHAAAITPHSFKSRYCVSCLFHMGVCLFCIASCSLWVCVCVCGCMSTNWIRVSSTKTCSRYYIPFIQEQVFCLLQITLPLNMGVCISRFDSKHVVWFLRVSMIKESKSRIVRWFDAYKHLNMRYQLSVFFCLFVFVCFFVFVHTAKICSQMTLLAQARELLQIECDRTWTDYLGYECQRRCLACGARSVGSTACKTNFVVFLCFRNRFYIFTFLHTARTHAQALLRHTCLNHLHYAFYTKQITIWKG